jgi:pheromone shutdown protein TraB
VHKSLGSELLNKSCAHLFLVSVSSVVSATVVRQPVVDDSWTSFSLVLTTLGCQVDPVMGWHGTTITPAIVAWLSQLSSTIGRGMARLDRIV